MADHEFIRIYGKPVVRRWRVETGDPHTDHHVMLRRMPPDHPAGRWSVESTNNIHHAWIYPDVPGALWRVGQLRGQHPDWTWVEVPPTPYDTELGSIPDEEL